MSSICLFTDSTSDLAPTVARGLDVTIIPMHFTIDGRDYKNDPYGTDLGFEEFYRMLREGKRSVTSAINYADFCEAFEPKLKEGRDILYLAFSSQLSSTYSASLTAANELMERYPGRQVVCIDTMCASAGEGLAVYHVARYLEQGEHTMDEAREFAERTCASVCHWFSVDDLMHLRRGGRIGAATAVAGSVLGIKPVMDVSEDGRLEVITKARGVKSLLSTFVDKMALHAVDPDGQTVFLIHADASDNANQLADMIKARFPGCSVVVSYMGPVIASHTGPGSLALFFTGKRVV